MKITPSEIKKLSYVDFISLINQWNVPPGAYVTLSKWVNFGMVDEASSLLEVACTTGFSSREMAVLSGCRAMGFDLSENSVVAARRNAEGYAPKNNLRYEQANGLSFNSDEVFSHVVVGASLGFFPSAEEMVEKCTSWLQDGGCLLASPFYAVKSVPDELVEKCRQVFGITVTVRPYDEIMKPYRSLELLYEDRCSLRKESEEELHYYCRSTIDKACKELGIEDGDLYSAMYDRLMEIKKTTNELREYQEYAVLVLRYRQSVYPDRYTELF